jgi:uncharacterized membrane protein
MKKILSSAYWADQDVEKVVGTLLRWGVVTASLIVMIGGAYYLYNNGQGVVPPYHTFVGEAAGFTTFKGITNGLFSFNAKGIIQFGVLVLIATPILRIAFSLFAFALERDKLYVVITLIVLCIMMVSIFGGFKG